MARLRGITEETVLEHLALVARQGRTIALDKAIAPERQARIRAAVEETAAEFGLTVSEIRLNGATGKTSPISEGEKSHGRRAR